MQQMKGIEEKSLHAVLDVSFDGLGQEQQAYFLMLSVLAYDVVASLEMLRNLWGIMVSDILV